VGACLAGFTSPSLNVHQKIKIKCRNHLFWAPRPFVLGSAMREPVGGFGTTAQHETGAARIAGHNQQTAIVHIAELAWP
jgi:hypothetical protein